MFTGIIQKTSSVTAAEYSGKNVRISVQKPVGWKLAKGASISVDGVCLTVIAERGGSFVADAMPETLKKTTVGSFARGRVVNLERALKFSDLLDGHLIQGHVDARARVAGIKKQGTSTLLTVSLPQSLMKQVALHGSLAINGVSLTVARRTKSGITVALIPYTLAHTNLSRLTKGDEVNIETDFLVRHLAARKRATVGRNATRRVRKGARG